MDDRKKSLGAMVPSSGVHGSLRVLSVFSLRHECTLLIETPSSISTPLLLRGHSFNTNKELDFFLLCAVEGIKGRLGSVSFCSDITDKHSLHYVLH